MKQKINSGDYLGEERDLDSIPMRGNANPQVGNGFTRWVATAVLALFGWRLAGRVPNVRKLLAIGAPHTSNWDWILVIFSAYALGLKISWLGKDSAFKSPLGPMFRYFGGVPVDRSAPHGLVGESVNSLQQSDELLLCITPEGTRSKVSNWKSGFYHIAHQAGVPITLVAFDFGKKVVGFGPTIYTTGDSEKEIAYIKSLYSSVQAKYPQKYVAE